MWKVVTEVGYDTLSMEVCFFTTLHERLGHHTRTYVPVTLISVNVYMYDCKCI